MRLLPDRPSLAFLRKEAKDLLAALREADPHVSLGDAQQALASQYGMRDWSELKSEAIRRAGEAPVAPDGLADELAAAFDLGAVTGDASPVSFTPMGRCWSLTTDRGRWLAVSVHSWITEVQAELGATLRDAAVATGIIAPMPVRSPEGRLIETVQEQHWRVHEWIEVGPIPVIPAPATVARRIGAIYGALHCLAIPSKAPINPYLTSRGPDAEWAQLLRRARTARKPWAEQLNDALPTLLDLRTIDLDIGNDETILCNCNLIPEHVRMGHNNELMVTEWDFAGSLTPRLELGFALGQWMLRPPANRTTLTAFRDGYVHTAGQWPRLNLSSFAVAVTGWLNWTYNTICEAIDPRDSDHATFAEQQTTDLLNRLMTRASLEQLLTALDR